MTNKDMSFNEQCYELLKLIPKGKVTTYKELAAALNTRAWRVVGSAMAKNKSLVVIPCHRVVKSNGAIGEYAQGSDKKARLLIDEGVQIVKGKVKDMNKVIFRFSTM